MEKDSINMYLEWVTRELYLKKISLLMILSHSKYLELENYCHSWNSYILKSNLDMGKNLIWLTGIVNYVEGIIFFLLSVWLKSTGSTVFGIDDGQVFIHISLIDLINNKGGGNILGPREGNFLWELFLIKGVLNE